MEMNIHPAVTLLHELFLSCHEKVKQQEQPAMLFTFDLQAQEPGWLSIVLTLGKAGVVEGVYRHGCIAINLEESENLQGKLFFSTSEPAVSLEEGKELYAEEFEFPNDPQNFDRLAKELTAITWDFLLYEIKPMLSANLTSLH